MSLKQIDELTNQLIDLTNKWEVKEFGNLSSWFKIFYMLNDLIKQNKDLNQINKINLALDVVEHFASAYANKYRNNLNEKEREILDVFINGEGASVLQASNDFVKYVLEKIDTDKDGQISKQECHNFFCCKIPK